MSLPKKYTLSQQPNVSRGQIYSKRCYFEDGVRKIDFVIVSHLVKTEKQLTTLSYYFNELRGFGIEFESVAGRLSPDFIFFKLHCPMGTLLQQAGTHNFVFDCHNPNVLHADSICFPCNRFHNITTKFRSQDPIAFRAYDSLKSSKPKQVTSWERSYVTYKILSKAKYGPGNTDIGFEKLIVRGIIKDAYPLHDGPFQWRKDGPLTDRQLLAKYWAHLGQLWHHQPLPLIYKYYGPEVAFHFSFYDFYIKMLVVPSILGLLVLIYNAIEFKHVDVQRVTEMCESNAYVCPLCFDPNTCRFEKLKRFCLDAKTATIFDNLSGAAFATFMGFWSIAFVVMWKRKEYLLRNRWNLIAAESDIAYRLEFLQKTHYWRVSSVSGEKEPYTPTKIKFLHGLLTLLGLLFMIAVVFLMVFLLMAFGVQAKTFLATSKFKRIKASASFYIMIVSAILATIIITFLNPHFRRFSVYLTDVENPKTALDYFNSCVAKIYATAFVNNYFPFFYIAFVKGAFYSHPGDPANYERLKLRSDICNPVGCADSLSIALLFFFALKNSSVRIYHTLKPMFRTYLARSQDKDGKDETGRHHLPPWERDFHLTPCGNLQMVRSMMELVIQYGFVIFFVAAQQLAPLMAFLTNIVNLRLDTSSLLQDYRRPVARLMPGIGAFNVILMFATFVGIGTNAFVIAFTSNVWGREIYRFLTGGLDGYINSTLSEFDLNDYPGDITPLLRKLNKSLKVCVYSGRRRPYYDEKKYEYSLEHFRVLSYKLLFVVVYENALWLAIAIVLTFQQSIPKGIMNQLLRERLRIKKRRYRYLERLDMEENPTLAHALGDAYKSNELQTFYID